MKKNRQQQIVECVTILGEAWRQKITPVTIRTYELGLADLDADAIQSAVMRAIQECEFMPTVFQLRNLAGVSTAGITAKDKPLLAWHAVRDAISRVGGYESVRFEDIVVNAAVRALGGWVALCDTPTSELHWIETRFLNTYRALSACRLANDQTRALPGISERDNFGAGHRADPVNVHVVRCLSVADPQEPPVRIEHKVAPENPVALSAGSKYAMKLAGSFAVPASGDEAWPK